MKISYGDMYLKQNIEVFRPSGVVFERGFLFTNSPSFFFFRDFVRLSVTCNFERVLHYVNFPNKPETSRKINIVS